MRKIPVLTLIIFTLVSVTSIFSIEQNEAEQVVHNAVSKEKEIDGKVRALINLAWYDSAQPQEVSEVAKQKLKNLGRASIGVLRRDIMFAPPDIQKEMIPILIHAYDHRERRWDFEYAHTFQTLLRSPEKEIKMMAMDALAYYQVPKVTLAVIDAIYEDPSLELYGIKSLGLINDPKAAKFLINKLASPDKVVADTAEEAISKMAGKMTLELKKGILDERHSVRERCLRQLLPFAKIDDLTLLYYVSSKNEHYDPELLSQLQETIDKLEQEKKAEELIEKEMNIGEGVREGEGEDAVEEESKEEK